jgi:hypothetical protein
MKLKKILAVPVTLLMLGVGSTVFAQTFSLQDSTARVGDETVTVDWVMTAASHQGYGIDIEFDNTLITPVLAEGIAVANCITNNGNANLQACNLVNPTTIRISMVNFTEPMGESSGTITFNVDPGAEEDDSSVLTPSVADIQPPAPVELVPGSVTIVGTDAQLTLAPGSFDFATQDIFDPAQSTTFTIGNDGVEDSLTITSVSVGGAPFSVTGNCDGQELPPQGSCVVTVSFDPDTAGDFTDTLSVASDVGNLSAALSGSATATPNIVINPPFGDVNFGFVFLGESRTLNGNVQNTGSADITVEVNLVNNTPSIFSTSLPQGTVVNLVAGAPAIDFTVTCTIPEDANDGEVFTGQIQVSVGGEPASDDTTHFLTCTAQEFDPVPIPTMQQWGLILFALMMLLAGGITIRFFRT